MLERVLEPEVMDSASEAEDYDSMDHSEVNRIFVADLLAFHPVKEFVLDVGTGTAQIPLELCRQSPLVSVVAVDLAEHMLRVGKTNVEKAGLQDRIELKLFDAKQMPFADHSFAAVISNSIVHHIPTPADVFAEMVRVTTHGGILFVRDLLRPDNNEQVRQLVDTYAGDANDHQKQMFEDSLRASLTVAEIRALVGELGFAPESVRQTTDRHWTWQVKKDDRQ